MEIVETKKLYIEGLLPEIANRYSTRTFQNKNIESEKINLLFEAARWAPSCYNEQPWRFIVGIKEGEGNYEGILSSLVEFNQSWAKSAPLLIAIVSATKWTKDGVTPNKHYAFDAGQAAAFLTIQAQSLGLYTHQMGGFDQESLKKTFEIPDGFEVFSVMAVGYLGNLEDLPDHLQNMEKQNRGRKAFTDIINLKKWGESLDKF